MKRLYTWLALFLQDLFEDEIFDEDIVRHRKNGSNKHVQDRRDEYDIDDHVDALGPDHGVVEDGEAAVQRFQTLLHNGHT